MKINIPTSLKEIKLKDYQKYTKILQDNPDSQEFINKKYVEIFCGLKINDVGAIKVSDWDDIIRTLNKTFESETKLIKFFKHEGVEYGFMPDLHNMSMGEYIDLTNYLTDPDTFHKALAVMYRPVTHKKKDLYLIEDYTATGQYEMVMREMGCDIYIGSQVFFYNLGRQLARHTLDSLGKLAKEDSRLQKILDENGDGITAFMRLLGDDSLTSMQSLRKESTSA